MTPIISETGTPVGKGSQRFKRVTGLTDQEKQAVINGETVLVKCPWADHPTATAFKQVTTYTDSRGQRHYTHRNFQESN